MTQEDANQQLVVAALRLYKAIGQKQQEMRKKWKAGEISEQDHKEWLKAEAEKLHAEEKPAR